MRCISALLLVTASVCSAKEPLVDPLKDSEVQATCGCSFQFSSRTRDSRTFLQWSEGEGAFIRVDGKLEKLTVKPVKSIVRKQGEISIGDSSSYSLSNDLVQVSVASTVAQICKPEASECESVGYKSRVVVRTRNGRASLEATGSCGC